MIIIDKTNNTIKIIAFAIDKSAVFDKIILSRERILFSRVYQSNQNEQKGTEKNIKTCKIATNEKGGTL